MRRWAKVRKWQRSVLVHTGGDRYRLVRDGLADIVFSAATERLAVDLSRNINLLAAGREIGVRLI